MGAKTWMLIYADRDARLALAARPTLDTAASQRLAATLFPGEHLAPLALGDLSRTCPPKDELLIGCFPGVAIVAAREFGIDYPSRLDRRFIAAAGSGMLFLHAMHSVVDWFAYAQWADGTLLRSLSVSPDSGILEDIGPPLPFETPYWSGAFPAVDDGEDAASYPLPFHPLDLAEAALGTLFGYHLEGEIDAALLAPETIPLLRYRRRHPWWRFWR